MGRSWGRRPGNTRGTLLPGGALGRRTGRDATRAAAVESLRRRWLARGARAGGALLVAATLSPASAFADAYVFPIDPSGGLTSGFGEFRTAHFHAGLDFSTDQSTGKPVVAIADGWVERVRASGAGYGRAIYLRLADGRTAVYAHLSAFAPALDAYVAVRQDSAGQYEQDLWPREGEISFQQGDVVGWSGESGAGPPHFHFELRQGDTNLNPLTHGFPVADGRPPVLAAAWLEAAAPRSRVAGGFGPVRVGLGGPGEARAPAVRGPFELALDAWDAAQGRHNRLPIYRLAVSLDGAPAFEAVFDTFPWSATVEVERMYDYGAALAGASSRIVLAMPAGSGTGIVRRGPAVWSLVPGDHRFEIEAQDVEGNTTRATLVVPVLADTAESGPGRIDPGLWSEARLGRPELTVRGLLLLVALARGDQLPKEVRDRPAVDSLVNARGTIYVYPVSVLAGATRGENRTTLELRPAEASPARDLGSDADSGLAPGVGLTPPGSDGVPAAWSAFAIPAESSFAVEARSGASTRLVLEVPAGALYEQHAVLVRSAPAFGETELLPLNPALEVEPRGLALRSEYRVRFLSPAIGDAPVGLFLDTRGSWSFLSDERDSTGAITGTTRRFGRFALLSDPVPPRIRVERGRGRARARGYEMRAALRDQGSGLDGRDQMVFLDGKRVPAEYDPEAGRVTWKPRVAPAPGPHSIRIEAVDRLGNRSTTEFPLEIR